jgi:hypothetical protein
MARQQNGVPGVGMPQWILLNQFGRTVWEAFGEYPYLVGSAAKGKTWRDVDVRLILEDDKFEALFGKPQKPQCLNLKWSAFCLAFSYYGKHITGLPIDFQIDHQTTCNLVYPKEPRHALIFYADYL